LDGSNGPAQGDAVKQNNSGAFSLGYTPTSVLELSNVAATIMSDGTYCPPTPLEGVTDRHGNPVPIDGPGCEQVVSPDTAHKLQKGLSKDHTEGTSKKAAKEAGWERPLMAKTG